MGMRRVDGRYLLYEHLAYAKKRGIRRVLSDVVMRQCPSCRYTHVVGFLIASGESRRKTLLTVPDWEAIDRDTCPQCRCRWHKERCEWRGDPVLAPKPDDPRYFIGPYRPTDHQLCENWLAANPKPPEKREPYYVVAWTTPTYDEYEDWISPRGGDVVRREFDTYEAAAASGHGSPSKHYRSVKTPEVESWEAEYSKARAGWRELARKHWWDVA